MCFMSYLDLIDLKNIVGNSIVYRTSKFELINKLNNLIKLNSNFHEHI